MWSENMDVCGLLSKYRQRVLCAEGYFFLRADDAVECIRGASTEGLELLGVEGFFVFEGGGLQPHMEFSDFWPDRTVALDEFVRQTIELVVDGGKNGISFQVHFEEGTIGEDG